MTYDDAVRYLLSLGRELAAPRQPAPRDAAGAHVQKFDLHNISVLADRLDNPHLATPCLHVAGTNGKGSTAAMLDSILRCAGLHCGLYTSPHLVRINERIRLDGREISDHDFARAFERIHSFIEVLLASGSLAAHPTFFECVTAMAFDFFAHHPCDLVVYETGMGGRLDSTNIVRPEVALITQIDFDHENFLGHSIEEIAAEKAGIIKPGAWVVSSAERPEARRVLRQRCEELGSRLVEIDDAFELREIAPASSPGSYRIGVCDRERGQCFELTIGLPGRFQIRNALAALAAALLLRERGFSVSDSAIARGLAEVSWPGRLERLCARPLVYLDGAHNPAGARALAEFWQEHLAGRRIHLVYGTLRDKPVDEIAGILFPRAASVILTQPRQSRALSAEMLARLTLHLAPRAEVVPDSTAALRHALQAAAPGDVVFAAGSLYLVGELRAAWPGLKPREAPC